MERPDGSYPKRFRTAVRLLMKKTGKETLPGTSTPAFLPGLRSAELMGYYYPDRPDLATAVLLLDAVRTGDMTLSAVRDAVGDGAADRIETALPPARAGDDWREPRAALLNGARDPDALRLLVADAMEALGRVERDLGHPWIGAEGWDRLDVERDDALWYGRELIASARRAGLGDDFLLAAFDARVKRLATHT